MKGLWRRLRSHLSARERLVTLAASLAVGLALAALILIFPEPFEQLDETVFRRWLTMRNQRFSAIDMHQVNGQVAVVTVDDATVSEYGWPLPRDIYPELIRRLKIAGITTVGLDFLFEKKGPSAEADAALRGAIADPAVVLPYRFDREGKELATIYPSSALLEGVSEESKQKRFGFTGVVGGGASEVRDVWLRVQREKKLYYSWPVVLLAHSRGVSPEEVLAGVRTYTEPSRIDALMVDVVAAWVNLPGQGLDDTVDIGQGQRSMAMLLNEISAKYLLEIPEQELPGLFVDAHPKIAVIGLAVTAGTDTKNTLVGAISGPEIQACTLLNLLENSFLIPASKLEEVGSAVVMALLVGGLGAFLNFRSMLYGLAGLGVGLIILNYWCIGSGGFRSTYLMPLFPPLVALILTSFVVIVAHLFYERRRLQHIVNMFREVCPVHNLEGLLAGQGLQLGGEEKELTILFSDLRGYTSFAEQFDSVTVLNTLNDYFGAVGHIFERFGGFVFDYQGDAQMVVFGLVPASQPNHAASACRAGAAMVAELERRREQWLVAGQGVPETGVGICTGKVSFGVLGTAQHKQYVAIGDPTNTASRVQGKSAELDFPVLLTESTVVSAGGVIPVQPLEKLVLKGKKEPLQVYGLKMDEMLQRMEIDEDGKLSWFFREEH